MTYKLDETVYPAPEIVECPFPFYAQLRKESPVHRLPNGDYLVTRWEDLVHVARNPEIFSNLIGPVTPGFAEAFGIEQSLHPDNIYSPWPVPFADPPEHKAKRTLLMCLVRSNKMEEYEQIIRRTSDELIDRFIDRGRCEFKAEFAEDLPPFVTLDIFGVPKSDAGMLRSWMLKSQGQGFRHATPQEQADHIDALQKSKDYFRALILDRADNPRDDFLSVFARDKIARDGRLDIEYVVGEVNVLFQAAYHNTVYMLTSAMQLLLEHPKTLQRINEDPALIRQLIEETLRLESPSQWLARHVTCDTEIRGVPIPKGAVLLMMYGAANRDESKFKNADQFDIDRPRLKDQLAFGYGVHRCLGEPLARLEGHIAFEQMTGRLKNLRLAPGQENAKHVKVVNKRSPAELHIEFEKR